MPRIAQVPRGVGGSTVGVSDRPDDYPSSSSALAFASRVTTNEKIKTQKETTLQTRMYRKMFGCF